jgi:hypothetical protein
MGHKSEWKHTSTETSLTKTTLNWNASIYWSSSLQTWPLHQQKKGDQSNSHQSNTEAHNYCRTTKSKICGSQVDRPKSQSMISRSALLSQCCYGLKPSIIQNPCFLKCFVYTRSNLCLHFLNGSQLELLVSGIFHYLSIVQSLKSGKRAIIWFHLYKSSQFSVHHVQMTPPRRATRIPLSL